MIVDNAEPFFFPGNRIGCLLIHGFTGAPTEMRPLGEFLANQGYTVHGVRLAGHGTRIEDMNRMRWEDWSNSVLDGWHILDSVTDQIYLVGLSMGGVLALYHASFLPARGVISLSTPYKISITLRLRMIAYLSWLVPYISKGKSDWQDPDAVKEHFSYDKYPTRAGVELKKLLEKMTLSLPDVRIPALLLNSSKDLTVPLSHQQYIFDHIGTQETEKRKIIFNNSGHVITRDQDKEAVFEAIASFIKSFESRS